MDQITNFNAATPTPPGSLVPWWLVRGGRGRVGGSTFLDFIIQRSRHNGRRVKPLDGDLRSRTLTVLYPAKDAAGQPMEDAASSPVSEELSAMTSWFGAELDASVQDQVCRAVDFGGGDRVIQEYGRDLSVGDFCERFGLGLTWAFVIGPDTEDLDHVVQVVQGGHVSKGRILVILNEGVIRQGQSVDSVFDRTRARPEFRKLLNDGAKQMTFHRLTCMDALRLRGLGFYEAAAGQLDREGQRTPPTMQHMVEVWLRRTEEQFARSQAGEWLA